MNKGIRLILVAIALFFSGTLIACDICGCFMGIVPYDNQSSVSLLYRQKLYERNIQQQQGTILRIAHGDDNAGGAHIQEKYQIAELRFRFFIHKRVELNAIVPYYYNSSASNAQAIKVQGLGDINILAAYHLLRLIDKPGVQHRLWAGGGIKLKTGSYYLKDETGNRVDLLLQPGTGSIDYVSYANYATAYRRFGASINMQYKINKENYFHEKIANSFSSNLNIFYRIKLNNWFLSPSVNTFYEKSGGLYNYGNYVKGTEVNSLMLGPGIDAFYKNIGLYVQYQVPVYEHPSYFKSVSRIAFGITYNFKQLSYLF